jgi:DUF4097 and DUF4098 domain-containing protein YvlB
MIRIRWIGLMLALMIPALVVGGARADNNARKSVQKTFDVSRGGGLELVVAYGDVSLKTWKKDQVVVEALGLDESDEGLVIEKSGQTVMVEYRPRHDERWRGGHMNIRFLVSLPAEFDVEAGTSGGDMEIDGAIKGLIIMSTSGGDIEVDDVDGHVELSTSGGDVVAGDVRGDVEVSTSGGDIEVGSVKGELEAATAGGDIRVHDVEEGLDASTAGGDIEVGNVGGRADVSTAGGDIGLGMVSGSVRAKTAGGDIELESADGEVEVSTAGGDLDLHGVTGSVDGETAGGDIIAELNPARDGHSSLETQGGDVILRVPEDARATIEARIRLRGDWGEDGDYDILSDFEPDEYDKGNRQIMATFELNGGGHRIQLETINGFIEVRKQ